MLRLGCQLVFFGSRGCIPRVFLSILRARKILKISLWLTTTCVPIILRENCRPWEPPPDLCAYHGTIQTPSYVASAIWCSRSSEQELLVFAFYGHNHRLQQTRKFAECTNYIRCKQQAPTVSVNYKNDSEPSSACSDAMLSNCYAEPMFASVRALQRSKQPYSVHSTVVQTPLTTVCLRKLETQPILPGCRK